MKVLVIGGGGREHALAWKLSVSPRVQRVYVAPGNGATASDPALINVALTDVQALADFAVRERIDLTVVGPEAPLAQGVVDVFTARGLRIFGPTRAAAQLESSKSFAKDFMRRHRIPTAGYAVFEDADAAHRYVADHGAPIVIKADGLAAGKGVVVATQAEQAHAAIDQCLGPSLRGARVVIEEFMAGEEASFIVASDGRHVVPLATSQDHKRLLDADEGPNTGGMGAYSPAPVVTPNVHARAMQEIILPTIQGMAEEGYPFVGFLYAGLMIDAHGQPRTVEFNARLGDPEAQVLLMRLKSDLFELLWAATEGALDRVELAWDRQVALGVVMAARGYPAAPALGDVITGLPERPCGGDVHVFHAGTQRLQDGSVVTHGGRVLCVTALGETLRVAQQRAYEAMAPIRFAGAQWRRDIGHRGLKGR